MISIDTSVVSTSQADLLRSIDAVAASLSNTASRAEQIGVTGSIVHDLYIANSRLERLVHEIDRSAYDQERLAYAEMAAEQMP